MSEQTSGYLSVVERLRAPGDLSILALFKKSGDLSTVTAPDTSGDLSIGKIDQRRRRGGITIAALLAEARVSEKTWRLAMRHPQATRATTLARLDRALDRIGIGARAPGNAPPLTRLYLLVTGWLAAECGAELAAVLAMATDFAHEKPNDATWLVGARIRRVAMYVVACEWQLGKAALANAIGCSRQNLFQAVKSIEELREREPALDALIGRVVGLAQGAV